MTRRTLSRTWPSHIVRNISTASEYGIAYSNSVRIGPCLRLFSVIVALEPTMRTLALFPLLLAINPSQIRIRRVTELFQSSFASKNLRSISSGMSFSASLSCPRCCDLTRLCWLVASPPLRDLLFFAKDLFVAAKHVRYWPAAAPAQIDSRCYGARRCPPASCSVSTSEAPQLELLGQPLSVCTSVNVAERNLLRLPSLIICRQFDALYRA